MKGILDFLQKGTLKLIKSKQSGPQAMAGGGEGEVRPISVKGFLDFLQKEP